MIGFLRGGDRAVRACGTVAMLHAAACAVLLYGYLPFCDVRALPWVARVEVFVAPLSFAVLLGLTAFAVGVVARALLSPSRWKLTLAAPSVICAVELGVCRSMVPPGYPAFRKPVQQEHKRPLDGAHRGAMQAHVPCPRVEALDSSGKHVADLNRARLRLTNRPARAERKACPLAS